MSKNQKTFLPTIPNGRPQKRALRVAMRDEGNGPTPHLDVEHDHMLRNRIQVTAIRGTLAFRITTGSQLLNALGD